MLPNPCALTQYHLLCTVMVRYTFFSDLQNVDITLRILFRPVEEKLPHIYANVGVDYDERILPSITTEVLKAVVVSSIIPSGPFRSYYCYYICGTSG